MKERALKIAKDVRREGTFPGHVVYGTSPLLVRAANIIEELVNRIDEMEKYVGFKDSGYDIIQLPQQTKLFTDDDIKEIVGSYGDGIGGYTRELFDKIEAKIKEKNVQKT